MRDKSSRKPAREWEFGEVLDEELTHIPEKYRSPLIVHYLEGLSREQAAQRLRITQSSLDVLLKEARQRLRLRLIKRGMKVNDVMLDRILAPNLLIQQIPAGLVEKTLETMRIWNKSNDVLESERISDKFAPRTERGGGRRSVRLKILLGFLLVVLSIVVAGMITYPMWLQLGGEEQKENSRGLDKQTEVAQALLCETSLSPRFFWKKTIFTEKYSLLRGT